jgi:hypothetical protein
MNVSTFCYRLPQPSPVENLPTQPIHQAAENLHQAEVLKCCEVETIEEKFNIF